MDRKIMDLIDQEVKRLPLEEKLKHRYEQYEIAKKYLCQKFPGCTEYVCKAIARRYGL